MGFAQGVSGLNSAASNLDVIGNNIANAGTYGFKSGSVLFSDVFAGSQIGLGTQVSGMSQNFAAGTVQSSNRPLDVAIVNGNGFFRLVGSGGEVAYSRNGQFNMDKDGYLVNGTGLRLTGYQVTASGSLAGGSPNNLQIPTGAMAPKATANVVAKFDLKPTARSTALPTFNDADSSTYDYSNAVTVFDSLGNSHELSTYFVKTAVANEWDVYATADNQALGVGGLFPPQPPTTPPAAAGLIGTVTFDSNGNLVAPTAPATTTTLNFSLLAFGNGTSAMPITMDISGTTQFGSVNSVRKLTQDGYTSGLLSNFAIGEDGIITGKYSNEKTMTLGQVVLSSFLNPGGLQSKGDNVWSETATSGQPLTGIPGNGTNLGSLAAGALETSNVDLTAELVALIVAQRTYQANAQTIKTQDQATQTLLNMR